MFATRLVLGKDITATCDDPVPDAQYRLAFDGCAAFGCRGVIFAHGLDEQVELAVLRIRQLLTWHTKLVVNAVGLSRGACAVLMLAQQTVPLAAALTLNVWLFDPVPGMPAREWGVRSVIVGSVCLFCLLPLSALFRLVLTVCICRGNDRVLVPPRRGAAGNLVSAATLNPWCMASRCADLTRAQHVVHAVALYPIEALPDVAFHAPLLPTFASSTRVDEDVVLGCHQGAIYIPSLSIGLTSYSTLETIQRVATFRGLFEFLATHGSTFSDAARWTLSVHPAHTLLQCLDHALAAGVAQTRTGHVSPGGWRAACLSQRAPTGAAGEYLNKAHALLAAAVAAEAEETESDQPEAGLPAHARPVLPVSAVYALTLQRAAFLPWYAHGWRSTVH